jgi:hypothetical protein
VHPYTAYKVGDRIEIDNYITSYRKFADGTYLGSKEENIIRKVDSSAGVVANNSNNFQQLNMTSIMQALNAEVNRDERNEYEAKIQFDDSGSRVSSISMIVRRK